MDMAASGLSRAHKLITTESRKNLLASALAAIEALLCVALLVVGGLLLHLLVSRGVTHLQPDQVESAPFWLDVSTATTASGDRWIPDTGLTSLIVDNKGPDSPWYHRLLVGWLESLVGSVEALQTNRGVLTVLLTVGLACLFVAILINLARRRITSRLAVGAASSLRRQIHRQMYRLGQSALPNQGVGPVLNLFTREVNDVRDSQATDLDLSVRLPLLALGTLAVSLLVSWPLTLFVGSLIGVCLAVCLPLIRNARQRADVSARDAAVQLCLLHEDLGLVRTVRVFGMEAVDRDRFDEHLTLYEEADVDRMGSEGRLTPTILFVIGLATALGVALVGLVVLAPEGYRLSLASVAAVAFCSYLLAKVAEEYRALDRVKRVAERSSRAVFDYLDRRPELTMGVGARFLAPLKDKITFEHVVLDDSAGRRLLDGVSAEISRGKRCAILGQDEATNLAMICLIPRLLDPTVGRLRIDGHDLKDVTLESLRAQVATILQSDLVFSDSVMANINLGDRSFTLPRVIEAAKVAHAHHFIQNLPQGYETVIGPLGHYLTQDEQYRIALARAFLHEPSILIIEEPTSPIEDAIKPLIDDTIDRVAETCTLIFLPHRLSTLRRCDQVILLNNGQVDAIGTPRDLMVGNKLYRHLQYVNFHRFATNEVEVGQMEG